MDLVSLGLGLLSGGGVGGTILSFILSKVMGNKA